MATLLTVGVLGLAACDGGAGTSGADVLRDRTPATAEAPSTGDALAGDAAAIAFMREEEKLARDVYAVLYEQWGVATFDNIAAAEQQHMDAVATLLERYGIEDPAADTAVGEFVDEDLQRLYDDLVARGSTSLEEALRVGALIEEVDIVDLESRASTDPTVQAVWDRLAAGSERHLQAFVGGLERMGVTYEAVELPADRVAEILAAGPGRNGR